MSAPKLPALRLTAEGNCVIEEGVSLDLPPNNKFSISYPPSSSRQNSSSSTGSVSSPKESGATFVTGLPSELVESLEGEESTKVIEEGEDRFQQVNTRDQSVMLSAPSFHLSNGRISSVPEKTVPRMSRTLSSPIPSQLHHLSNPYRSNSTRAIPRVSPARPSQISEVSVELADSIQLAIQTMLQISPPQVLDSAKELFSACALSVPTPSISAMFTAMKNINYISANMSAFCADPSLGQGLEKQAPVADQHEFDVGEILQSLGDALSGSASQAGVDLVIYHGDASLKHAFVSGDEGAVSFSLSHVIRQILHTTQRGDSIELGLLVGTISDPSSAPQTRPPKENDLAIDPLDSNGPIRVTIRISHRFAQQNHDDPNNSPQEEVRPQPVFSTLILRRVLQQIGGQLVTDLPPEDAFSEGRTCNLELILDRAAMPMPFPPDPEEVTEPSLEILSSFRDTLKGKRVTLYASAKGSFAHHLTAYLTAWGMDVTHVSPDGQVDGATAPPPASHSQQGSPLSSNSPQMDTHAPALEPQSSSLIFIDDDVDILKERLQALRFENQPPLSVLAPRKRPSLSSNHRPKSSSQMSRLLNLNMKPAPVVILHFTSLSNFKLVKDVMQSINILYAATATPLPEVMIIPKPAGPRRFLTALHTAITKPTMDPFFMPIATSPMSPGSYTQPSGQSSVPSPENSSSSGLPGGSSTAQATPQTQSPSMRGGNRPLSSRTNSDRSTKSFEVPAAQNLPPSSPLAIPDNVEYFSTAAAQKLGTSASSGLVIQSPDGQTAGIYFHPRSKNSSRHPSSQNMERDRGQLSIPSSRRQSTSRSPANGNRKEDAMTFSSLYGSAQTTTSLDNKQGAPPSASSTPVQTVTTSPVISASVPTKIVGLPSDDTTVTPSTSRRLSASSKLSDDTRKVTDAPRSPKESSNSPLSRKTLNKRPTLDNKDSNSAPSGKQKAKASADANVIPPISVLIVDDNPINQTILSTFMRRKKIKYDLASNGQEAVQKWKSGGFHLILMDIQMPVMDGIQATKEIRRLEKTNAEAGYPPVSPGREHDRTPSETSVSAISSSTETTDSKAQNSPYRSSVIIVALTASSLQSDRLAALAAGCNDFLTKPVSLLWLNNKIIEWGSIKALQMWADIRPEVVRSLAADQAQAARNVADRLQVPKHKQPSPTRRTASSMDEAAALALASSGGPVSLPGLSPTSSSFVIPERPNSGGSSDAQTGPFRPNGFSDSMSKGTNGELPVAANSADDHSDSRSCTPEGQPKDISNPPASETPGINDKSSCAPEATETRKGGPTSAKDLSDDINTDRDHGRSEPPGPGNRPNP